MTTKFTYESPEASVMLIDLSDVLCGSVVGSGADDILVKDGWTWGEE